MFFKDAYCDKIHGAKYDIDLVKKFLLIIKHNLFSLLNCMTLSLKIVSSQKGDPLIDNTCNSLCHLFFQLYQVISSMVTQ